MSEKVLQADVPKRKNAALSGMKVYFKEQAIPLIVLLMMVIIASCISPVFLSAPNVSNLVVQVALNMVVAMGMFVVILTGGIDLGVGSVVAVAGVLVAGFMRNMPVGVAIIATMAICTLIGCFNGLIVARLRIAPFIVTLGMMSFARGVAYWYTQAIPISWTATSGADFMYWLGSGTIGPVPVICLAWLLMIAATFIFMRFTVIGRIMYSLGGNEEAVKLSGISVAKWKVFPYAFSAFCCALGGILLTARLGVGAPTSGDGLDMDAIASVVIGGVSFAGGSGSVSGVVIGVFILGIINNILDLMNVPNYPQLMLKGAIIVVAVILSTIRDKKR
ncbi:ABC transporter permease [Butyricicoccus sp. Marseille-Q5471]|uniref:ABC transporter permease n=1 Tax=Butyricicoccus sp. Marseille-Q5471 TaxID=3039493 RepID=UPI0024BCA1C3|nr:ABC transporter permease [Butyricicoccus sp. Marseille-Q5471]